jgi:AcrR family transcriptional regulator
MRKSGPLLDISAICVKLDKMAPRERILDSAAKVFAQYGYRLASMELVAQECDLSRQALYHHFDSKEALFRAVVEAVGQSALEAERAAAARAEQAGKGLADVMVAQLEARYRYFLERLKGSPHAEELISEHQRQTGDLLQRFAGEKFGLIVGTIERVCAANQLTLKSGLTAAELARCIELASHGFGAQKTNEGALADLARSIRLLVAGAVAETPRMAKPRASRSRP